MELFQCSWLSTIPLLTPLGMRKVRFGSARPLRHRLANDRNRRIALKKSPNITERLDLRNIVALEWIFRHIIIRNGPKTNQYFLSCSVAEFFNKIGATSPVDARSREGPVYDQE